MNSTSFEMDGNDGGCTLREAIVAANMDMASGDAVGECAAGSGPDVIMVPQGMYSGSGADNTVYGGTLFPVIRSTVTIQGSITGTTALLGGIGLNARILAIAPEGALTLRNITVTGGLARDGGGLYNAGTLSLWQSVVSENQAGLGAAASSGRGGGIFNSGVLTVSESRITTNEMWQEPLGSGQGGGIFNTITGTLMVVDSEILSNVAGSEAGGSGGGIYNDGGVMTIERSTIAHNGATSDNRGSGAGGGIFGPGVVRNSTVAYNEAGGLSEGAGGISGAVTVTNSTIVSNTTFGPGGVLVAGISGEATLHNTIVAFNGGTPGTISTFANCGDGVTSLGYNLEDQDSCGFGATGDVTGTNPLLGPLQANGGPTLTMALLLGSPAIDAGDPTTCVAVDQRGVARPQDGEHDDEAVCDIGAYEATFCPNFIGEAEVSVADILFVAAAWGSVTGGQVPYDLNHDNQIDLVDVTMMADIWNGCQ